MGGRDLLEETVEALEFDPESVAIDDSDVLALFEPTVREWWVERYGPFVPENGGFFTPPQKEAIPLIHERENALICAPTGSGKTQASFAAIVNELFRRDREQGLDNAVYCLYISPLKSLANDIHRNLEIPLSNITEKLEDRGEDIELRHAIRHGDTDDSTRNRMLEETPHILNTTPETLAILLNSPKFKRKLETVEYVVVDEIHSLAANKRGTHLSVSLERLEAMTESSPTRIGCSATVEPLETIGEFLVGRETPGGPPRAYEVVDARFTREFDLELSTPTDDLIHTAQETINDRFYGHLHDLIQAHTNTLVFTNTRSGAERVLHNLR
ncbi:MAG: DEAD/DEAH box helicase, partial [archaeon]